MRLVLLIFVISIGLGGCARHEIGVSGATITEMATAIVETTQEEKTRTLAQGIGVLGDAIHKASDPEAKPVVTAQEAAQDPNRALGKAEAQAERTITAGEIDRKLWEWGKWAGGTAIALILSALGLKGGSVVKSLFSIKDAFRQTVHAIEKARKFDPTIKAALDPYLVAAHNEGGKKTHEIIEEAQGWKRPATLGEYIRTRSSEPT